MNDLLSGDPVDVFDQNKDYLADLVGDGKKFKTPSELAKGKAEADAYISTLTKKMDADRVDYLELRKQVDAMGSLEDLKRQILEAKLQQNDNRATPQAEVKPSYDPNEFRSLIREEFLQSKAQDKANDNFNKVQNKLKEKFGNNFPSVLKEQADMLGLSKDDVNGLAMKSPEAFFRTMGLNEPEQRDTFQNLPRSNIRSDNFAPKNQKRTWSYYQEMKKNQPELYLNPKTTVQMHNDAAALGDAFEDGDFHSI